MEEGRKKGSQRQNILLLLVRCCTILFIEKLPLPPPAFSLLSTLVLFVLFSHLLCKAFK